VLVLALLVAVWGSFLVPLRYDGTVVPVSWLIVAVGNVVLGRAGGRLLGWPGALGTGVVWIAVALSRGSEPRRSNIRLAPSTRGSSLSGSATDPSRITLSATIRLPGRASRSAHPR